MKRALVLLFSLVVPVVAQAQTLIVQGDTATILSVGTQGPAGANIPAGGSEGLLPAKVGAGFGWSGAKWNTGLNYDFDLPILGTSFQLKTGARPTCAVSHRGEFWHVAGATGVADTVQMCIKNEVNTYAWKTILGATVNVKDYGATGDGTTDDTIAIRAAVDAIPATGGTVYIPAGVYKTTGYVSLKTGVTLQGVGPGASTIKGTVIRAIIDITGRSDFGIRDLTITTDGTTGIIGIQIVGSSFGSIHDVEIAGTTYAGLYIENSSDINISDLKISDSKSDAGTGGIGLWLFDNVTRVTVNGLIVDGADSTGVWLDAQTTGGTAHPVTDCTFNGLVVRNFGRTNQPSAGFGTQGAQRCSGSGWVIGPSYSPTTLQNHGLVLNVDQSGVATTDCVLSDISIVGTGSSAIKIRSGARNQLSNVRILDPDGALVNYGVIFDEGTVDVGGPPDNVDNTIDGLDVTTSGVPYSTNYSRTVLFNAAAANCHRNRVLNLRPGIPTDVPIFWNGANAPSTGINANIASYLDTDGVTTRNTGAVRAQRFVSSVSADRGDTDQTLTVGTDAEIQRWATTLTANRTITLSSTGCANGDHFRVVRTGLGAFTLNVGGLKTIPSATAAFVDVVYNGTAWVLAGYGPL